MSITKKNIWILGGTGFIGKALIRQLSNNTSYLLHLLVHKNIPYKDLESFTIITGNLENFDLAWLEKYPPDIIFHLARIGGSNVISRFLAAQKGARANHRLINFLSALKSQPVVVYVSGSLMYGNQTFGKWADEFSELSPVSYARYYIEGERPWIVAQKKEQLDIRFARPGWVLGTESWFKTFYWMPYLTTGKIPLYGDGHQFMSLIHIDDCAGQIVNLALQGRKNQNFNIFSGPPISQREFAETLARLVNTGIDRIPIQAMAGKYGKTVTEAFTSSIPLRTRYCDMASLYTLIYPDVEAMLSNTISILKYQEPVFAKLP